VTFNATFGDVTIFFAENEDFFRSGRFSHPKRRFLAIHPRNRSRQTPEKWFFPSPWLGLDRAIRATFSAPEPNPPPFSSEKQPLLSPAKREFHAFSQKK